MVDPSDDSRNAVLADRAGGGTPPSDTPAAGFPKPPRATPLALLDDLDAIVWEMDPLTRQFTFVTAGAERILGYPREQWIDEPDFWQTHIHPDDRNRAVEFCTSRTAKADDHEIEYRMIAADGREVWLCDIVHVVPALGGSAGELHGVMVDVSKQKAMEAELRASEDRFSRFAEASVDGIIVHDMGRIIDSNGTFDAMLGYAYGELAGRMVMELTIPEEREMLLEHIASGSEAPLEGHAVRRDGTSFPVEIRARNVTFRGTPKRFVVVRDLTERRSAEQVIRESEQRYRRLVEAMPDGVAVHADGRLVFINDAGVRMLGAAQQSDVLGLSVLDLFHPDSLPAAQQNLRALLRHGGSVPLAQYRLRRLDGSDLYAEVSASTLEFGGRPAVQIMARDMTERLRAEVALQDTEHQLRQSQKLEAVGRLAGGIAHDFNNLLTVITVFTQLVIDGLAPSDPRYGDLKEVAKAAYRAGDLTRQLLAFSRKQVMRSEELDLNAVVRDVETMLRRVIGEDVRLETLLVSSAAHVRADRGQIEQVLMNLVVNARDAMSTGGTLTIATAIVDVDDTFLRRHAGTELVRGRYVRLDVTDTGSGMDDAVRGRLFEPFFTTKPAGTGTGLGLSTVYGIVKQSNGFIGVRSAPGEGATFSVYLPEVVATGSGEPARAEREYKTGSETILVVEDEDSVRQVARRILETAGYRVIVARNGLDALDLAGATGGPIDLLLTDLVMPGLGGRELAERLVNDRPSMRVLFMSGYTEDEVVRRGVEGNEVDLLTKPFTVEKLANRVRAVLDERR